MGDAKYKSLNIIDKERKEIIKLFPELHILINTDIKLLGQINFTAQMPQYLELSDSYLLRIEIPKDIRFVPKVYGIDGKIQGFHTNVYPYSNLCLGATSEIEVLINKNPSIIYFIHNILIPFLYRVSYNKKYDITPGGDIAHRNEGLQEHYLKNYNESNIALVDNFFSIAKNKKIKGHYMCPCKSGKKIRDCHKDLMHSINSKTFFMNK